MEIAIYFDINIPDEYIMLIDYIYRMYGFEVYKRYRVDEYYFTILRSIN